MRASGIVRRLLLALTVAALVLWPDAARACQDTCLGVRPAPARHEVFENPQLACSICGGVFTVTDTLLLPALAATLARQNNESMPATIGALTMSSLVYSGSEVGLFWLGGKVRPVEHWLAIFAVRGVATALAFVAGKQLSLGGTVLVTGVLVAASAVPLLVFDFDERRRF